jgi:transcriptional regulator with XRE-family HTH domain
LCTEIPVGILFSNQLPDGESKLTEDAGNYGTAKASSRKEFGRRLQNFILKRGWTQSDLARETGIGKDSISGYVRGRSIPSPLKVLRIAEALEVRPEDLSINTSHDPVRQESSSLQLTVAQGDPSRAWLTIDRELSFSTAAAIIKLIESDDIQNGQS